jgi:hypothetical protein
MEGREITQNESACISECILKHWSNADQKMTDRDNRYGRCLTECNVCS